MLFRLSKNRFISKMNTDHQQDKCCLRVKLLRILVLSLPPPAITQFIRVITAVRYRSNVASFSSLHSQSYLAVRDPGLNFVKSKKINTK